MRRAAPLLLLLAVAANSHVINTTTVLNNDTILLGEDAVFIANDTIVDGNKTIVIGNDTIIETDGEHAPIVRKKRTFGDIVFRGLADVLGYDVQRKPAPAAFPPPLDPVPGIDTPLQQAGPAPPPCGAPRAAGPPPCRPPRPKPPPPPPPPPPCPKPRAAPKPKPRPPPPPPCPKPPPPPPPPPPPCPKPRGNPCAKDETGAELITSNLQLSFNINRNRPTQAPAAESDEEFAPIAIEPRAARLPAKQERKPQVFVDAFVVRDGVKRKVDTVDADVFNTQQAALDDDYIADDDDEAAQQVVEDDYEDVQQSRDKAQRQFGRVVNQFWEKNSNNPKKLPKNHYKNVHFGDRDLVNELQRRSDSSDSHQNLQRERSKSNRVPVAFSRDTDEEYEETTTTEDPRHPLRPRVLPPTEHNPNQIDTVTVRVPPIYKEKRPKKLHRGPDRDEEDNQDIPYYYNNSNEDDSDSDGENSGVSVQTEPPRQKRRKKSRRRTRSTREHNTDSEEKEELKEYDPFSEFDYDYYGKKLPISDEEKSFRQLSNPEPTKDTNLARIEENPFLDDHERLVEDPERIGEDERLDDSGRSDDSGHSDESGRTDDSGRSHDKERLVEDTERSYDDTERTDERQRADSSERTDALSPHAEIRETGYRNNYLKKTNVRVDDPRPLPPRKPKKKKA